MSPEFKPQVNRPDKKARNFISLTQNINSFEKTPPLIHLVFTLWSNMCKPVKKPTQQNKRDLFPLSNLRFKDSLNFSPL